MTCFIKHFMAFLALSFMASAAFAESEWIRSRSCAISTELEFLKPGAGDCWYIDNKKHGSFSEYREFQSNDVFVITMTSLAGPGTVWRSSRRKDILWGIQDWLEEQNGKFSKARPKTLPVNLWVKRARHWNLETDDYGAGCFAITSLGGSAGDGTNRQSAHFGALVCRKDKASMPVNMRETITASFRIKHRNMKKSFK